MINETLNRSERITSWDKTFIVTGKSQSAVMEQVLMPEMPRDNILYEPVAKNTAPCILYAALRIWEKYGDGVMCVLAADHHIPETTTFLRTMNTAVDAANTSGQAVVIGIKPTFASTGYGYIKCGAASAYSGIHKLDSFIEKPDHQRAIQYVESGAYLWNSGMFVWKVSTILELFERFLPKMYNTFIAKKDCLGTPYEASAIASIYQAIEGISVDYGIMERLNEALVVPGDFGWNDVGSWDTLDAVIPKDILGNVVNGQYIGIDSGGNTVQSQKLVATIGIQDMVIVEAEDAILVCPKARAQEVKTLVDELKARGMGQFA